MEAATGTALHRRPWGGCIRRAMRGTTFSDGRLLTIWGIAIDGTPRFRPHKANPNSILKRRVPKKESQKMTMSSTTIRNLAVPNHCSQPKMLKSGIYRRRTSKNPHVEAPISFLESTVWTKRRLLKYPREVKGRISRGRLPSFSKSLLTNTRRRWTSLKVCGKIEWAGRAASTSKLSAPPPCQCAPVAIEQSRSRIWITPSAPIFVMGLMLLTIMKTPRKARFIPFRMNMALGGPTHSGSDLILRKGLVNKIILFQRTRNRRRPSPRIHESYQWIVQWAARGRIHSLQPRGQTWCQTSPPRLRGWSNRGLSAFPAFESHTQSTKRKFIKWKGVFRRNIHRFETWRRDGFGEN